jgi:hypothetical protein
MLGIVFSALGHISAYAGLLGLYLSIIPWDATRPPWHWLLIAATALVAVVTIVMDVRTKARELPTVCKNSAEIRDYMNHWLRAGGRVASVSRDVSWADKDNERVLLEKAKRRELILCVEKGTPLTKRLEQAGAEIIFYGGTKFIPKSRFTIVDFGRDGARVAVGTTEGGRHVINEFRNGHHPLFAIAEDLVNLMINRSQGQK